MQVKLVVPVAVVLAVVMTSGLPGEATGSSAGSLTWPEWHGPKRDNISPEAGLLREWPEGGPEHLWTATGCGKGYSSVTIAEAMLYCLDEKNGTMALVPATPDPFTIVSRFLIPSGGEGMYWAHPVVCDGRLDVRHADTIYTYDIRAK